MTDAPRVQYTKTADGVNIAYCTQGTGPALVVAPNLVIGHVRAEWDMPVRRRFFEQVAERMTVVRYDCRGHGMSQRDVLDYSIAAATMDLEAVTGRLGLQRFAMYVTEGCGTMPIAYAASNADRVTRLAYYIRAYRRSQAHMRDAIVPLMDSEWELFVQVWARLLAGWNSPDAQPLVDAVLLTHTPDSFRLVEVETRSTDRENYMPGVQAPTLLMYPISEHGSEELAGRYASLMPDAELMAIPGETAGGFPNQAGTVAMLEIIQRGAAIALDAAPTPHGTAIILFADIVDSTVLTERLGDGAFRAKARELDTAMRSIIGEASGTAIDGKLLGDGVLATFASAKQAIEAALACGRAGDEMGLPLHLGLHAGDVIRESDPDGRANVYGGAVNIAARISGLSAPGEVLVSATVRDLARTSAGVTFEDRGEQALKGIDDPVRVWAVVENRQSAK